MPSLINDLLGYAPPFLRDAAVTAGSARLQRKRRSGIYEERLRKHRAWRALPRAELLRVQQERLAAIIRRARELSPYYRRKYEGVDGTDLMRYPVLEKAELRAFINEIVIGRPEALVPSFTGGTTGTALTVYNSWASFQERFAILDVFYEDHGFKVGRDRVAWFSGRALLWPGDERAGRFWRTNWLDGIRYYSTFHMTPDNLLRYATDLNAFRPAFVAGFPSAIGELARVMAQHGLRPAAPPRAVFTTSESLDAAQRELIEAVFGCPVRNQYAASEGAPFIMECREGRLHIDLVSGVIEVVDDAGRPACEGDMLVTCFYTTETPIIRYRIGDAVRLSDEPRCACGWDTPLVDAIHGRRTDYLEVPGRGRIYNAQIGDCVKDVPSVVKFQVALQGGRLAVDLVADQAAFDARDRATFLAKLAERIGDMPVDIRFVTDIPRAASGKHSLIRLS